MTAARGVSDHRESTRTYYSGSQLGWRVLIIHARAGNRQELTHVRVAQNVNRVALQDYGFFFPKISLLCLCYF